VDLQYSGEEEGVGIYNLWGCGPSQWLHFTTRYEVG